MPDSTQQGTARRCACGCHVHTRAEQTLQNIIAWLLQDGHDHVYVLRQQLVQSNGQVQQLHEKLNQAVEYGQQLQETLASSTAAQTALQKGVDTSKLLVAQLLMENVSLMHGLGM